ncbi:MAG: ChuX/HutX family heme-like substrate-binding protein [Verrucomicrobiota bacterium]
MIASIKERSPKKLRKKLARLKESNPNLRSHEAAKYLQCSEMELLAAGMGAHRVSMLGVQALNLWMDQIRQAPGWTWLLRNENCLLERENAVYSNRNSETSFSNRDTHVEFFPESAAVALYSTPEKHAVRLIQLFDAAGKAIFKLALKDHRQSKHADAAVQPFLYEVSDETTNLDAYSDRGPRPETHSEQQLPFSPHRSLIEWARDHDCEVTLSVANQSAKMTSIKQPKHIEVVENQYHVLSSGFNLRLLETNLSHCSLWIANGRLKVSSHTETGACALTMELPANAHTAINA